MAERVPSIFDEYEFTAEELKNAIVFSNLQRLYMQSKVSQCAVQKLNLVFDPTKSHEFMQQEAYVTGKIDVLLELLVEEETTLPELLARIEEQQSLRREAARKAVAGSKAPGSTNS